jgi:hypothetical protein
MHPLAGGVHQHRARAVQDVSRGHLTPAHLEAIGEGRTGVGRGHAAVHGEDRAGRDIHVDVGRSVERVMQQDIAPDRRVGRHEDGILVFFRRHHAEAAGVLDGAVDGIPGEHVQLVLLLTG